MTQSYHTPYHPTLLAGNSLGEKEWIISTLLYSRHSLSLSGKVHDPIPKGFSPVVSGNNCLLYISKLSKGFSQQLIRDSWVQIGHLDRGTAGCKPHFNISISDGLPVVMGYDLFSLRTISLCRLYIELMMSSLLNIALTILAKAKFFSLLWYISCTSPWAARMVFSSSSVKSRGRLPKNSRALLVNFLGGGGGRVNSSPWVGAWGPSPDMSKLESAGGT